MTSSTAMIWVFWALSALISGFGAYFGAYFRKKGENLATHEDIDKLVDQVRAVTTTTKEIEAKIESDVWARQKSWEVKRDVLFNVTKAIGVMTNTLTKLYGFYLSKTQSLAKGGEPRLGLKLEVITNFHKAAEDFEGEALLAALVCGRELNSKLTGFSMLGRKLSSDVTNEEAAGFQDWMREFIKRREEIWGLIRKEMDIEQATPLSSGSSATPRQAPQAR
jgi:hypothetical protein